MNDALDFLARHGAAASFVAIFADQIGIPLPAVAWLLAVGALAAPHLPAFTRCAHSAYPVIKITLKVL